MSKLLVRPAPPDSNGRILNVTPENAGWQYVGFAVHRVEKGNTFDVAADDQETCVVIVSGKATVRTPSKTFENIGDRMSVFEDKAPYCVYVPSGMAYSVEATSDMLEVALCRAPGDNSHEARLIEPTDISIETRGTGTNRRIVRNILPETEPAHSLLIAEVITPGGNWSSYPPHKHDSDKVPEESALEETYYYKIEPEQGFAFQRVYTDDRSLDETITADNGSVVLVPEGYHPVGAPHGYDVYYLNVMAGPKRTWIFKNDPAHDWIMNPA